jgi:hypothetical protein
METNGSSERTTTLSRPLYYLYWTKSDPTGDQMGRVSMNNPSGNANQKLEILRKREAALRAAIAAEKVRQQKKNEKDDARLFSIVGAALVQNATQSSDFHLMLKQVLQAAELRDTERALLISKGWL